MSDQDITITSFFETVDTSFFRNESLALGANLVKSCHVSKVREEIRGESRRILGNVLKTTPGAGDVRKNTAVYKPVVELNPNRTVHDTNCTCKGGRGFCRHAAALCIFVNIENTCSKTGEPIKWNRPPQVQLDKYHKGAAMKELFPPKQHFRLEEEIFQFENVASTVTESHLQEDSPFIEMIKAEFECQNECDVIQQEKEQFQHELNYVVHRLFILQSSEMSKSHQFYKSTLTPAETIQLTKVECPTELRQIYENDIKVNEQKWHDICLKSVRQSETAIWFRERFLRITSSSKAHKIKTQKTNFDTLASSFIKQKHKGNLNAAMSYGLSKEHEARKLFEQEKLLKVYEVGLIISMKQPFLACSPDGIIFQNHEVELLEIKCPYSCENTLVVDYKEKRCMVPYLNFDEFGAVQLSRSHMYFTQIQVSMYLIAAKKCHFYVYSPLSQVYVQVDRDEAFLAEVIPKIEWFYFTHFLPLLSINK